jgi:acyl-CoA thioester hydrolase
MTDSTVPLPDRQARSRRPASRANQASKRSEAAARRTRVRVRYADTDRMGIAYYANYLVWFEVGRTEWLRDSGSTYRELEQAGVLLPVVEAHCEYRRPARYDDEIEVSTTASLLTHVRLRFDYEVWRLGEDTPLATGYTVHASLDPAGRPCRLPPPVREMLREKVQ